MILTCNSCEKKFVVPDNAISAAGRLVQCSSCGNKWTQYPLKKETETQEKVTKNKPLNKKVQTIPKKTKQKIKKRTGPNLYSPEYLAKKHGIKIDSEPVATNKKTKDKINVNFGFYNSLIVTIVILTFFLRVLYFTQDTYVNIFPMSEIYIDYLFESIKNVIDIIVNFFSGY